MALLDDFTTGPDSFSVPPLTNTTRYQTGSMPGGVRSTFLNNGHSPGGAAALLAIGDGNYLLAVSCGAIAKVSTSPFPNRHIALLSQLAALQQRGSPLTAIQKLPVDLVLHISATLSLDLSNECDERLSELKPYRIAGEFTIERQADIRANQFALGPVEAGHRVRQRLPE